MDFGPLGSSSIFIWGFLKDSILAHVEALRLVIELWYLEGFWEYFFFKIIFLHGEIFQFS
jgi:hypothetical protein